jgi:metal-responsive CopG/Arc/MetJ family transcriptional regulator
MNAPLRRFDVIMPPDLAQDMQNLVDETGHSRGEIFRRAMALYKKAIETRSAGGNVIFRDGDGTLRDVVGLGV